MWNTEKKIEHHEKLILLLEMIEELEWRISQSIYFSRLAGEKKFFDMKKHHEKRVEIDQKIKERLINSYNNRKNEE